MKSYNTVTNEVGRPVVLESVSLLMFPIAHKFSIFLAQKHQ